MQDNTSAVAEGGSDASQATAQQTYPTTKLFSRKEKRPRNPEAYFLSAEEVGYLIGMQEVDARALMKAGTLRAYKVKSRLKTTRQDVEDFLQKLRVEGKGLANVVVVHVPDLWGGAVNVNGDDQLEARAEGTAKLSADKGRKRFTQLGPPVLKQRKTGRRFREARTQEAVSSKE